MNTTPTLTGRLRALALGGSLLLVLACATTGVGDPTPPPGLTRSSSAIFSHAFVRVGVTFGDYGALEVLPAIYGAESSDPIPLVRKRAPSREERRLEGSLQRELARRLGSVLGGSRRAYIRVLVLDVQAGAVSGGFGTVAISDRTGTFVVELYDADSLRLIAQAAERAVFPDGNAANASPVIKDQLTAWSRQSAAWFEELRSRSAR